MDKDVASPMAHVHDDEDFGQRLSVVETSIVALTDSVRSIDTKLTTFAADRRTNWGTIFAALGVAATILIGIGTMGGAMIAGYAYLMSEPLRVGQIEAREERHATELRQMGLLKSLAFADGVESERSQRLKEIESGIKDVEANRQNMHRHILDEINSWHVIARDLKEELGVLRERVATISRTN